MIEKSLWKKGTTIEHHFCEKMDMQTWAIVNLSQPQFKGSKYEGLIGLIKEVQCAPFQDLNGQPFLNISSLPWIQIPEASNKLLIKFVYVPSNLFFLFSEKDDFIKEAKQSKVIFYILM